jgi:hypothetical protein
MIVLPLTNGTVLVISVLKLPTINELIFKQVSSAMINPPLLSLNNHVVMGNNPPGKHADKGGNA